MTRPINTWRKRAFGIEPAKRRYRFRLARYFGLAETLGRELPPGTSRVLDAGCGKGRVGLYWSHLAPQGKTVRLLGMDISPDRLKLARVGYTSLLRADLLRPWPFPEGGFDAVICEQVLEHFSDEDIHFILSEIRRVLKPGGFALIGTPVFFRLLLSISPIWKRIRTWRTRFHGLTPSHLQHFHLSEIVRRIEERGLTPVRVRGFRFFSLPGAILEDSRWYYRLHQWFGARFPGLCVEVGILARRSLLGLAYIFSIGSEYLPEC